MLLRKVGRAMLTAAAGAGLVAGGLALSTAAVENAASVTVVLNPAPPAGGYADQTPVTVSVGANSTFTPGQLVNVLECADPGGLPANLPIDASTCDGTTIQPNSVFIKSDGSFAVTNYPIFELPNTTLGENAAGQPVCDLSNFCVLYVGQDQNDFTQPKTFSQPFLVGTPSTTAVSSSAPSATFGTNVTLTATVTDANQGGVFTPNPTGTVGFTSDGTPIAGCTNVTLTSGAAACSTSTLGGGSHAIKAVYSGDAKVMGSSGTATQVITGQPTVTTLSSSNPTSGFGAPVTFTASVSPTDNGGTVTFTSGTSTLCSSVALSGGKATCTTSSLPIGSDAVTAAYSGDQFFGASSATLTETIVQATTTLSAAPAVLQVSPLGANLWTLKATLKANGAGLAGQTLTFTAGSTLLCTVTTDASGNATCTVLGNLSDMLATVPGGYTVTYGGSALYKPSSASAGLIG